MSFFGCCIRAHDKIVAIGARCGSPDKPVGTGFVDIYIDKIFVQRLEGKSFGERFGVSIALNNDFLCIGAYRESTQATDSGCVYVYQLYNNHFVLVNELHAIDKKQKDFFGYNIAIDKNNILIVGSYAKNVIGGEDGKVYVFNLCKQQCSVEINCPESKLNANFGRSVAIFDDVIYIGSHKFDKKGVVYSFSLDGELLYKYEVNEAKGFGNSICVNKKHLLIGAYETNNNGKLYIFDKLHNCVGSLSNKSVNSFFAGSISATDKIVAIGSYRQGKGEKGKVYLYDIEKKLLTEVLGPNYTKWFGYSVYVSQNVLFVGSVRDNSVCCFELV